VLGRSMLRGCSLVQVVLLQLGERPNTGRVGPLCRCMLHLCSFTQTMLLQLGERPDTGRTGAVPLYALRMQLRPNCAAAVGRMAEHRQDRCWAAVCFTYAASPTCAAAVGGTAKHRRDRRCAGVCCAGAASPTCAATMGQTAGHRQDWRCAAVRFAEAALCKLCCCSWADGRTPAGPVLCCRNLHVCSFV